MQKDILKQTTLLAAAIILTFSTPAIAQEQTQAVSQPDVVRVDKVKADLTTKAKRNDKEVFHRTVARTLDEGYTVVIKDEEDRIRMTGSYRDEELRVAEGLFTFYYPNGQVESTGYFDHGLKTGAWERFTAEGDPRAVRIYTGKTWEEIVNERYEPSASGTEEDQ